MKKWQFPYLVLLFGGALAAVVYLLHRGGLVVAEHEHYMRQAALAVFLLGVVGLAIGSVGRLGLLARAEAKGHTLLVLSLLFLLVSAVFPKDVSNLATGCFAGAALVYFVFNRTFYRPGTVYLYFLLYALLMIFGTIGTAKGFRFPDTSLSFLVLPLAYSCITFRKELLLHIGHFFFRAMLIYMAVCLIYWLFNFLYLDVSFGEWITRKLQFHNERLIGWDEQMRLAGGQPIFAAYNFVNAWAGYFHPSYISLPLFCGLIIGFYLQYKQYTATTAGKFELGLYLVLAFMQIALMESRIGLVNYLLVLVVTGLYFIRLRTGYFNIILIAAVFATVAASVLLDDRIDSFLFDSIRKTDYTLAVYYIKDHFWWGTGLAEQHLALTMQEQLMAAELPPIGNLKTYVHNQFLGNMVQFGVWGLFVLIAALVAFFRYAVQARSYLLQMFLLIVLSFMMIEEPLYGQKGITLFTVFFTFFVAVSESDKPRRQITLPRFARKRHKSR